MRPDHWVIHDTKTALEDANAEQTSDVLSNGLR